MVFGICIAYILKCLIIYFLIYRREVSMYGTVRVMVG